MPTKVLSYNCNFCGTPFDQESAASICEKYHVRWEDFKITGGDYAPEQSGGFFKVANPGVPNRIRVKWGDDFVNIAEYVLSHVGTRGI